MQQGDYKRLFTAGFLHVDVNHLIFNLFTFYFFSDVIVQLLGPVALVII